MSIYQLFKSKKQQQIRSVVIYKLTLFLLHKPCNENILIKMISNEILPKEKGLFERKR